MADDEIQIHHGGTENSKSLFNRNSIYTCVVKTTVTLRHDLVRWAERTARKMRISRNRLFSTEIIEFLERRRTRKITGRLNKVYCQEPAKLARVLERAQAESLKNTDWR